MADIIATIEEVKVVKVSDSIMKHFRIQLTMPKIEENSMRPVLNPTFTLRIPDEYVGMIYDSPQAGNGIFKSTLTLTDYDLTLDALRYSDLTKNYDFYVKSISDNVIRQTANVISYEEIPDVEFNLHNTNINLNVISNNMELHLDRECTLNIKGTSYNLWSAVNHVSNYPPNYMINVTIEKSIEPKTFDNWNIEQFKNKQWKNEYGNIYLTATNLNTEEVYFSQPLRLNFMA